MSDPADTAPGPAPAPDPADRRAQIAALKRECQRNCAIGIFSIMVPAAMGLANIVMTATDRTPQPAKPDLVLGFLYLTLMATQLLSLGLGVVCFFRAARIYFKIPPADRPGGWDWP